MRDWGLWAVVPGVMMALGIGIVGGYLLSWAWVAPVNIFSLAAAGALTGYLAPSRSLTVGFATGALTAVISVIINIALFGTTIISEYQYFIALGLGLALLISTSAAYASADLLRQ